MKATRREFLSDSVLAGITAMFARQVGSLAAAQANVSTWASHIGLELYTVRDLMATDCGRVRKGCRHGLQGD